MRGISKHFGQVHANVAVDFTLHRGEIHAIVGENGAGKSTLMKILYGLYQPDAGEIFVDGRAVTISSPRRAMQLGLGMVQQHFTLIPVFTALQNIVLAKEPRKFGALLDYQQAGEQIAALAAQLGFDVPLNTPIESLPIGAQQHTEILKVLYHGTDILIMDEPTAVLAPQEVEGLFNCMRNLKSEGKSLIIITHKLDEVMAIADTVTVMRRGQAVASCPINDTDPTTLAEMILGEPVIPTSVTREQTTGTTPLLRLENATLSGNSDTTRRQRWKKVFPGEIVGIAGVEGNGQTELVQVLTGLRQIDSGTFTLNGERIAHIPADRHRHGISLNDRIDDNFIIGHHKHSRFCRYELLQRKSIQRYALNALDKYQIRVGDITDPIRTLSGGNQQKVVVARELEAQPEVIIAAHPTRGLDIHAAEFVHTRLIHARNRAKAVLLVSSELDELLHLSDRIAVMYDGKIVGVVKPSETNKQELGALMLGLNSNR
ncbi:Guanosine import ATP-binding protein NupO [Geodia barretti]|uniref:Guanosine import ATP-binding protein NupO n=1 Tax=Geodia barretti TaxID=519541 RepID=A0AA35X0D1_GEOBA|nr:Guanosine import ATP-binding protein NupO [Geodia barretti]